jgi:hypothetical protein
VSFIVVTFHWTVLLRLKGRRQVARLPDRDGDLEGGARPRRAAQRYPAAERLDAVLEPDQA